MGGKGEGEGRGGEGFCRTNQNMAATALIHIGRYIDVYAENTDG